MHPRFLEQIGSLEQRLDALCACKPHRFGELPTSMAQSGVYLFSEDAVHLYVGRSNRLRDRYFLHCRPGSQQNQASFAYKLAREMLIVQRPSYRPGELSRKGLAATPEFVQAFSQTKERIRKMEYRFVAEPDQTRQALLEAYCAIVLETPYNDFDTH